MLEPPPPKEDKSRTIDGLDLHQPPLPPIASKTVEPEGIPPSPQYNKLFDSDGSTKSETPELKFVVPPTPEYGRMHSPPDEPKPSVASTTVPTPAVYSRMQSPPEESSTVPPSAMYSRLQSPPDESSTIPPSAVYSRMQSPPEDTSAVPPSPHVGPTTPPEADKKKDDNGAAFFMTQVYHTSETT